uniref:Calponin-homology (CH) domain-containing protein n=1 Tax=Mesocestoides corti TaxID=53468 RepID=A0A5K3FI56_MESCO
MEDKKQKRHLPSESYSNDDKRMETQSRVFRRWVNSQLKQTTNGHELEAAVEVFRDVEALLGLAQELANRKASTSDFQPSDGLSTQENAIVLIERLYGHDIAVAVQLACDCFHHTDDASLLPPAQLTLCLDVLWMLAVAAGAGTGPVEEVQTGGTFSGSVDSSTSTLIGQRSKRSSVSSVLPEVEQSYTRTPALDRWLARQDERLLAWCQDVTGSYEGINVCNYTTSWRDGLAFLAIVNQQRPDLFNYKARLEKSPLQNLGLAFHLITKEFAVPRLLETEDLCSLDAIDARSVAIYLTELRSAVENDRKRRNRPSFEICTAAMENLLQVGPNLELDPGVTVTVTTTSSRSSSPTASELTFCSEDASEPENINQLEDSQLTLADFQHSVERNLAWMLSMEERLGNNFQDLQPFFGDKKGEENIVFEDKTAIQEARDITALENSQILDVSSLAEGFLTRLEAARKQFNTHEDLTAHLAKHQATVSRCLRYGHRLVNLVERVQRMSATSRSSTSVDEFNNERSPMEHLRSVQSSEVLLMASVLHARWTNLSKATEMGNQFLANCLLKRQEALLRAVEIQLGKLEWEKRPTGNRAIWVQYSRAEVTTKCQSTPRNVHRSQRGPGAAHAGHRHSGPLRDTGRAGRGLGGPYCRTGDSLESLGRMGSHALRSAAKRPAALASL